jgi:hypothetical protein
LEELTFKNEMMVCCTNIPDRHGATLYGMLLCVSAGIEEDTASYPASAKVAFRYLGRTIEEITQNCTADVRKQLEPKMGLEENLKKLIPKYLYPEDWNQDETISRLVKNIRNEITSDQIPLALRMEI